MDSRDGGDVHWANSHAPGLISDRTEYRDIDRLSIQVEKPTVRSLSPSAICWVRVVHQQRDPTAGKSRGPGDIHCIQSGSHIQLASSAVELLRQQSGSRASVYRCGANGSRLGRSETLLSPSRAPTTSDQDWLLESSLPSTRFSGTRSKQISHLPRGTRTCRGVSLAGLSRKPHSCKTCSAASLCARLNSRTAQAFTLLILAPGGKSHWTVRSW
jgi:hypothetical protein